MFRVKETVSNEDFLTSRWRAEMVLRRIKIKKNGYEIQNKKVVCNALA
jgi:hypothetical protein